MFSHIYYNFKLYLYINSTLPRLVMLVAVYSYLSLINFHYLIKINQLEKSVAIKHTNNSFICCFPTHQTFNIPTKSDLSDWHSLNLYTLTSVLKFSILFFINFPRTWQREIVLKSRASLMIISFNLMTLMFDSESRC